MLNTTIITTTSTMIFLFSTILVILNLTSARTEEPILIDVADLSPTIQALNLARLRFSPAADENKGIFKRQTIAEELIPAADILDEDIAAVQQQSQEQPDVFVPAVEVAPATNDEPAPARNVKTFSNSGLRR